jgi:hypothetical protein
MTSSLAEDYFRWLGPQIREEDGLSNPNREFWGLLTIMHETQFDYINPNDDNREGDGRDLRVEYCRDVAHIPTDALRLLGQASFLEVLIALSRRLAFNAGMQSAPGWAWVLLNNLNLHRLADPLSRRSARKAQDILETCIYRRYDPDGVGGFFPLEAPLTDQREVEIWYQMAAYIEEVHRRRGH